MAKTATKVPRAKKSEAAVAIVEREDEGKMIEVGENVSVQSIILRAIELGTPVETMEKLLDLQERIEGRRAKRLFDDAMANFQGECPIIKKSTRVAKENGTKLYDYAKLEVIVSQVRGPLRDNGFSYSIQSETLANNVKVTCIAKHKSGHSEPTTVEVPLGTKTPVMSATQQVAAALTFAKRYAFCNAFGILTGDEDTDASKETVETPGAATSDAPSREANFDKVKGILEKTKDVAGLKEMGDKISKSSKYTAKEKKDLQKVIDARIKELGEK